MPDSLESGTLNTPGIVGLSVGIDFIESFGLENVGFYKHMLVKRLHEGLRKLRASNYTAKRSRIRIPV
jgi:selenocysteine lyase/cysteine desulfurase